MNLLKPFLRAVALPIILFLCGVGIFAQEKKEKVVPPPPTGLTLEVDTKMGQLAHHPIPGSSYGGIYKRLASWKQADDSSPRQTFKIAQSMDGDGVRVKVFVLTEKFYEGEVLIGNYLLHPGEKAVVEEMTKYGYEPMEITVIKVNPSPPLLPSGHSRIPSVEVVGVEAKQGGDFPAYKVTLRNLSYKDITYLEVKTFGGGRELTIQWPRDEQNQPIVKAGAVYEMTVRGGSIGLKSADGYTPDSPHIVDVTTAVFTDKSYEGDAKSAARFLAELWGEKRQVERVLALLNGTAPSEMPDFEKQAQALERDAQQSSLIELRAAFPNLAPESSDVLKAFIESGLNEVRKELLKDIQGYSQERERGPSSKDYNLWRNEIKQKYEAWLSRL